MNVILDMNETVSLTLFLTERSSAEQIPSSKMSAHKKFKIEQTPRMSMKAVRLTVARSEARSAPLHPPQQNIINFNISKFHFIHFVIRYKVACLNHLPLYPLLMAHDSRKGWTYISMVGVEAKPLPFLFHRVFLNLMEFYKARKRPRRCAARPLSCFVLFFGFGFV